MGNCSHKGVGEKGPNSVRIVTDNGGIIEFEGSKIVQEILSDFPGYGVFRQGRMSSPLGDHERLLSGQEYYLLPLGKETGTRATCAAKKQDVEWADRPGVASDPVTNLTLGSALEVLPSPGNGVWRVKLVMDTKQLEEILSEEVNTEALIEKMRMAASSASRMPKPTNKSSRGGSRNLVL